MKLITAPDPAHDHGLDSPVPEELRPFLVSVSTGNISCRRYPFGYILRQEIPVGVQMLQRFYVSSDRVVKLYAYHSEPFLGILYNTKGHYHCQLKTELYIQTKTGDYGPYYSPPGASEVTVQPGISGALHVLLQPDQLVVDIASFSPPMQELLQHLQDRAPRGHAITLLRMNSRIKEELDRVGLFDDTAETPDFYFHGLLYNLVTELTRQLHQHRQQHNPEEKPREKLRKVYEFVVAHPNLRTCTMDQLAQIAGLSESNLRKLFRQVYEQPVQQFVRQQCLQKAAKIMLENASMRIEDIAFEVGYANQANLSNAFKVQYGVYPQEYRKRHQSD